MQYYYRKDLSIYSSHVSSVITHHVFLRELDRGVDSIGAAEGQVLAHPLLHVREQLLQTEQESHEGREYEK